LAYLLEWIQTNKEIQMSLYKPKHENHNEYKYTYILEWIQFRKGYKILKKIHYAVKKINEYKYDSSRTTDQFDIQFSIHIEMNLVLYIAFASTAIADSIQCHKVLLKATAVRITWGKLVAPLMGPLKLIPDPLVPIPWRDSNHHSYANNHVSEEFLKY